MQKLKPEIENLILEKAELEFYQFGYEQTSLRQIIKTSHVSIGNFYNYFESKEDLFDRLVREEYIHFNRFMAEHDSIPNPLEQMQNLKPEEIRAIFLQLIQQLLPDFNRRFVMLIEGSKGSKYEQTRIQLLEMLKEHLQEHAQMMNFQLSVGLMSLLAEQFLNGVIQVIKENETSSSQRNEIMSEFILFFFSGVMGLIGFSL